MKIALLLSLSLLLIGCQRLPPELHGLYSVTVTVTDGGKPVPEVHVSLSKIENDSRVWSCAAVTNASGVAVITSSLRSNVGNGAAPGTYKVILAKSVPLPPELQPTEAESEAAIPPARLKALVAERDAYQKEHRVIPAAFATAETSPVEVMVEKKNMNELTIDISKFRSVR